MPTVTELDNHAHQKTNNDKKTFSKKYKYENGVEKVVQEESKPTSKNTPYEDHQESLKNNIKKWKKSLPYYLDMKIFSMMN